MAKLSGIIRTAVLIIFLFLMMFLCVLRLLKLQIVDGPEYLAMTMASYTAKQELIATRGRILDCDGKVLTASRPVYMAVIQKAFLKKGTEQDVILRTVDILKRNGEKWNDSVPLTYTAPFDFIRDPKLDISGFKELIGADPEAGAEECLSALEKKYGVTDEEKYTAEQRRIISGVLFEMERMDFSHENYFVLAEDITVNTVTKLREYGFLLNGIDIIESSVREYIEGDTAPHVLGTVGSITKEDYAALKEDGYRYNDVIGKYGVELAMESVLRGTNGEREITRDMDGNAVSDVVSKEVKAGDSVMLTLEYRFQNDLQEILKNQINWLNNTADRGNDCNAGAVVVLNAKTGAVLGMASYPTYNLTDSVLNYEEVLSRADEPMYNRCIKGLYRPGSAFKTITAADGLINGLIDRSSRSVCTGVYTYYPEYHPKCTGYHLGYGVVDCLKWSCNIFFYDLGRRLGIDELSSFAEKFGYGRYLGLEIGGLPGQMSSPEVFKKVHNEPWTDGNTLQAAIGQMDTLITPLHLAVQACTLANDGVRYKPYLIDSVWDYDLNEMIYKTKPQIVDVIENKNDAFGIVREGMTAVSTLVNWPTSSALWNFEYLPSKVAIKTGTAETGDGYYTSTVMGYYPAEDPQIAFGIVLEKGEYSRYMVRNVIDAYFYRCYEPDMDENGIVLTPWKRWSGPRAAER